MLPRHTTLIATALFASAAFATTVFAQGAPAAAPAGAIAASKIAVVNIQGILRDASSAKSVRDQLEAKQKAYQSELSKKEEALQKEDAELAKQKSALSKEAFEAKVKAFRDKATATQKEVAEKKATLDAAFERSLGQIQKTVTDIIADLSKEKGFIVALPTSQILYAEATLDISQEVLSRLNQKLPKVDVKFDAPASAPAKKQ